MAGGRESAKNPPHGWFSAQVQAGGRVSEALAALWATLAGHKRHSASMRMAKERPKQLCIAEAVRPGWPTRRTQNGGTSKGRTGGSDWPTVSQP